MFPLFCGFCWQDTNPSEGDSDSGRGAGDSGYITEEGRRNGQHLSNLCTDGPPKTLSIDASNKLPPNGFSQQNGFKNYQIEGRTQNYQNMSRQTSEEHSYGNPTGSNKPFTPNETVPLSPYSNNYNSSASKSKPPNTDRSRKSISASSSRGSYSPIAPHEDEYSLEDLEERHELLVNDILFTTNSSSSRRRSLSPAVASVKRGKSPSGSSTCSSSRRTPVVV